MRAHRRHVPDFAVARFVTYRSKATTCLGSTVPSLALALIQRRPARSTNLRAKVDGELTPRKGSHPSRGCEPGAWREKHGGACESGRRNDDRPPCTRDVGYFFSRLHAVSDESPSRMDDLFFLIARRFAYLVW
jgi:hypothetical protein